MAQECGFFNAQLVGEEYDRVYLAEQFAAYFASFIGNGIFGKSMQQLEVMANNDMTTKVLSGQAWINGWWYRNTTEYNLSHSIADGVLSRIDVIVLRWDNLERDMYLHVIKGTPSAYPVKPDIVRDADYYDLQLAVVSIPAGSVRITQAQITDTRLDNSVCGLVTGVVDQIDTTDLYNQFETYFREWKEIQELDYENWTDEKKQEYNIFVQDKESEYNQWTTEKMAEYVAWIANNQADFIQWFNEMKDQLSEDAAGHLQLEIDELREKIVDIKLVHIFINYDTSLAGANITATNGDETYTVVASDTGLSVIDGMSLGTWTISEDEYGISTTIQTVYYGNYNCGIGGGVFINVNFDEEFIGKVITLTNGTKTYTSIATSSLTVMFVVADYGTWTVSGTVDGQTYSNSVSVTKDGSYSISLQTNETLNLIVYSAAEDTVYYYPDNDTSKSPITLCTTDSTGKATNVKLTIPSGGQQITFYSTVAKDTTNATTNYTKNVNLSDSLSDLFLMPEGAIYWYGNKCTNMESGGIAQHDQKDGMDNTNYGVYNKNSIVWNTSSKTYQNVYAPKNIINHSKYSKAKVYGNSVAHTQYLNIYTDFSSETWKYTTGGYALVTSGLAITSKDFTLDCRPAIQCQPQHSETLNFTLYALWVE